MPKLAPMIQTVLPGKLGVRSVHKPVLSVQITTLDRLPVDQ